MRNRKPIIYHSGKDIQMDHNIGKATKAMLLYLRSFLVLFLIGLVATFIGIYSYRVLNVAQTGTLTFKVFLDLVTRQPPAPYVFKPSLIASILIGMFIYVPYFFKRDTERTNGFTRLLAGMVIVIYYDIFSWGLRLPDALLDFRWFSRNYQEVLLSQALIILLMLIFTSAFKGLVKKIPQIKLADLKGKKIGKLLEGGWFLLVTAVILIFVIFISNRFLVAGDFFTPNRSIIRPINLLYMGSFSVILLVVAVAYWPHKASGLPQAPLLRVILGVGSVALILYLYSLSSSPDNFIASFSMAAANMVMFIPVQRSLT